nr:replication initiation protein [SPHINX/BMMF group 2 DNA sequence]
MISKSFQNIGIALLGIRWLSTSVGQKKEKGHGYSKAAAEVCKYALKFGDLSVEKTWEAFKVLKGKRLTGSFGLLWGVKIPDTMTDDMPLEDLPYLEMLYKFAYSKKSYYDLLITRHVEPHSKDNDDEEELRQRGEGGRSDLAITDDVRGAGSARARSQITVDLKRGRKKAHWRIPPKTRVRVRQRIRRWDGIMYNIDLFPYVEHRLLAFIG